ncbi:HK97 family phage major capsid protein [Enterococcus phoeniculicola]|uniref:HK97 family phage major capsid protein n=1 Tax=Enterococcus phoeniculicola ATCC BAA-412 TaxID=1158610 RepID=R3TLX6_9ENTE|nr:phage major capsid protein [Enterococcus phoeniculicola]EOL42003.1 HK97 family phage major capsid protein [Enterococcus phoeniculicola ATCC BAA-412]EOT79718.1 HK97 family phage major capsid protein [Enterococcus phoeniculicola ATCC BAA-412]OJG71779.1 HK97 family phage major capsid protein [Enterococcus phoeniculicola]
MTIKLSKDFENAKSAWIEAVQNNESTEKVGELYGYMLDQMIAEAKKAGETAAESYAAGTSLDAKLNAEQRKFFNEINKEVGYKEETLLPQETIDNIFEDVVTEHPLLSAIGLKNAGLRLKFLKSETSGVAVWGKVFDEIKGQLDASFSDEEAIQNKLTAFVVVPKDLTNFGPAWIESFVRLQIQEAFAVAMELAFLSGTGKDQPVGLNRQVQKDVAITGGVYPEKATSGKLTFADSKATIKELTEMYKYHSTKENGKSFAVGGKVALVVNPTDAWGVKAQYTFLNANGVYVTALPYNLSIIESVAQVAKKAVSFVGERYDAYTAGGVSVKKFDQTLALEDLDLCTAKTFVYGKAKDDKVAAVWDLAIPTDNAEGGSGE